MAKNNNNGTARWVRWILGIAILALIAVATATAANRVGIAENRTNIMNMSKQLDNIEHKLDKALGLE